MTESSITEQEFTNQLNAYLEQAARLLKAGAMEMAFAVLQKGAMLAHDHPRFARRSSGNLQRLQNGLRACTTTAGCSDALAQRAQQLQTRISLLLKAGIH